MRICPGEDKVDVESGRDRIEGVAPFGYQGALRIVSVHPGAYVAPKSLYCVTTRVFFDQRCSHIHPEPVKTLVEPEHHYVFQFSKNRLWSRGIRWLLPAFERVRICVSVIERGLTVVEVFEIVFSARTVTSDKIALSGIIKHLFFGAEFIYPDIIIRIPFVFC